MDITIMKCPSLNNLEFSETSKLAIKEIRWVKVLSDYLATVAVFGTFANIFAGNGPIKSHYNLTQTDFDSFLNGVKQIPQIGNSVIQREAFKAMMKSSNNKERLFWRAFLKGCKND